MADTLKFMSGAEFTPTGQAVNTQAKTELANLGVQGNQYTNYVATPATLSPQTPITVPEANYESTINSSLGALDSIQNTNNDLQKYIAQFTPQETELDKKYKTILDSISNLTADNTGKEQFLIEQQNKYQVPAFQQQISELNSQILSGIAEQRRQLSDYQKANLALEQTPMQTAATVGTKQQELARTFALEQSAKSADLGLLQARQAGLNGQLTTALNLADRAVSLKYKPIEDELKIKEAQLQAIKPFLDRQESIQAQALQAYYTNQQQQIADKKAKAKENLNLALSAGVTTKFVNQNGKFFDSTNGEEYSNPQAFFRASGVNSFEDAYSRGLVTDLTNSKIQDINTILNARSKYSDVYIPLNASPDEVRNIIKTSRIYQKDTYIAPTNTSGNGIISGGIKSGGLTDIDILAQAVSNKLGSVSAKNSFEKQYNQAKTEEQKIKILASNVVLPTEVKNGIIQNTQVTKSLDDVLNLLNNNVKTGLLAASQSYIANKLGTGGDKAIETIKSKLVTAVQPYRNKVTGAAWGDQEEAEYQSLIGSVKFSPTDLANKIQVFKETLKQQSQTAILAGIDPLGAINSNSILQSNSNLGGSSLEQQVKLKGYDYLKMKADGYNDEQIKQALNL